MRNTEQYNRRVVLGTCGVGHAVHDGFIDGIPMFLPIWTTAFGLSLSQAGLLSTFAVGVMAAIQIPASLLAEKIGERTVLAAGTAAAGFAYLMASGTTGYLSLILVMVMLGLGTGVQHPLGSSLVSGASSGSIRHTAIGIYNFTGDVGKVAIPAIGSLMLVCLSWQKTIFLLGVFGIFTAIALFIALGVVKIGLARTGDKKEKTCTKGWGITDSSGYWILSSIYIVDIMIRMGFVTLLPFLVVEKGAPIEQTGLFLGLLFAGGAAGKFICGMLSTRIGVFLTVLITEIVTGVGIVTTTLLPLETSYVLYPLVGIALNGTSSSLYGSVADFVSEERRARTFGLFYTLGVGFGAVTPAITGFAGDAAGVSTTIIVIGISSFLILPLAVALRPALRRVGIPR
jgi:FSR family fosmidomycin resistance protein-like MFS transporter